MKSATINFQGKKVFYRTFGDGKRKCFFYHGFPGSSIQAEVICPYLEELDLQICSIDRPGYGASEKNKRFQISDTPDLIEQLAQELRWKKFIHVAVSGGTPYALAASQLKGSETCLVFGALGPLTEEHLFRSYAGIAQALMLAALFLPSIAFELPVKVWKVIFRENMKRGVRRTAYLSKRDVEVLANEKTKKILEQSVDEAFAQGVSGPRRDIGRFQRPWNFDFHKIACPVILYHGTEDRVNKPAHSEHLHNKIPTAVLELVSGEGHYSLPIDFSYGALRKHLKG